jgi:transposase-like protein
MARRDVLADRCYREFGQSPDQVIPRLIMETGSVEKTARRLDVAKNTIAHWVKTNGYRLETWQCAMLIKVEA